MIGPVLRSLAFYLLFYGGSVPYVLGATFALPFSNPVLLRIGRAWSAWHRWLVVHVLGITVKIEGTLPVPGALLAVRHESFFEALDMPNLLDRPVVFAKSELMRIPFWGWVARGYGLIEVERDQGARALRAMIAAARAANAIHRQLVIFPEGTRVPAGQVAPLQSGFAGLYKLLGLPVVPVSIDSGAFYHHRWKRPGTITYRFGEPIPPGLPRAEIEARVLAAINPPATAPTAALAAPETLC